MTLAGHAEAWEQWRSARAGARLHHAWLLAGRRGLGKAHFAYAAALELVGPLGDGASGSRGHPDVLTLEPLPDGDDEQKKRDEGLPYRAKRNITVDQVRAMQRRLTTRPTLGDFRAVVIDAADDLEKGAVNALLKALEEPPVGTIFLLVAHRPGRLLPTVRSRCRTLRFPELDQPQLARLLESALAHLSEADRQAALAVANGSPGAALAFAERKLGDTYRLMCEIAEHGDPDLALRGALLGAIGARPDREQQLAVIEAARMALVHALADASPANSRRIIEAHAATARLLAQAPTANFDPTALVLEIGGLLASAAADREAA